MTYQSNEILHIHNNIVKYLVVNKDDFNNKISNKKKIIVYS